AFNLYWPTDWAMDPRLLALLTTVPQALTIALAVFVLAGGQGRSTRARSMMATRPSRLQEIYRSWVVTLSVILCVPDWADCGGPKRTPRGWSRGASPCWARLTRTMRTGTDQGGMDRKGRSVRFLGGAPS